MMHFRRRISKLTSSALLLVTFCHLVDSSNSSSVLYNDQYSTQITQPMLLSRPSNETLATGDTNPEGSPVVYFSAPSSSTDRPVVNMTSMVEYEQPVMSPHVEFDDGPSPDKSTRAGNDPDRSNSEEMQLLLVNSRSNDQPQQWNPMIRAELAKQVTRENAMRSRKSKKKPVVLIAQSVPEEEEDEDASATEERVPTNQQGSPVTKYVVLEQQGGSRMPLVMQSSNNNEDGVQDGGRVMANANVNLAGKDDRMYDYYSHKLATGPPDASNQPYSVPPPPPPPPMPGMPIMANVFWRKIVYPVVPVPVPMTNQNAVSAAASTSTSTLDRSVAKPRGQKYIVYYVRKDNGSVNGGNQGLRLISSSNDQQHQLAQNIIRQIETMEANSGTGLTRQPASSTLVGQSSLRDQDMVNSQLNSSRLPSGQLIELNQSGKQFRGKLKKQQAVDDANEEVIVIRRPKGTPKRGNGQTIQPVAYRRKVQLNSAPVRYVLSGDTVRPVRPPNRMYHPQLVKVIKI